MTNKEEIKIGAHVSAAGAIKNSIENAERIGANTFQIFGSSPRQWYVRTPDEESVGEYKEALKNSNVTNVFLHAPYLINLASQNKEMVEKSKKALVGHMQIASSIGAEGVVFHIGSVGKDGEKATATGQIVEAIKYVLDNSPQNTQLIMENVSGGGGKIGVTATEMGEIIHKADSGRLKICIDTAHAFGAGILDFTPTSVSDFLDEWERETGKGNIVVIHANDSKAEFGSLRDLHENIGEGYIGLKGFRNLVSDKRVRHLPWILETPGYNKKGPDKKNVRSLRSCF